MFGLFGKTVKNKSKNNNNNNNTTNCECDNAKKIFKVSNASEFTRSKKYASIYFDTVSCPSPSPQPNPLLFSFSI